MKLSRFDPINTSSLSWIHVFGSFKHGISDKDLFSVFTVHIRANLSIFKTILSLKMKGLIHEWYSKIGYMSCFYSSDSKIDKCVLF